MVLAQSSAIAACQAIDRCGGCVQRVDVAAVMDEFAGNPLADGSQPELFVDNSDAENVVVSGDWKTEKNAWSAYGPDFLSDDSKGTFPKSLRYVPRLPAGNEYDIYVYFPKVGGATTHTLIRVFDGGAAVRPEDPVVGRGRRRTDRRRMGAYRPLSAAEGRKGYVEISNEEADGIVVADAVLFIPARSEN